MNYQAVNLMHSNATDTYSIIPDKVTTNSKKKNDRSVLTSRNIQGANGTGYVSGEVSVHRWHATPVANAL